MEKLYIPDLISSVRSTGFWNLLRIFLPDSVANQIAAGEVIQRPASVVKELVENAIDAEAEEIHVLITDAGKTCIQVIDDGKGMSETDARLSFERHATSKIREAADLFALRTMGFRGEALASIAAVAEVELKTRPASEELGTRLLMPALKSRARKPFPALREAIFPSRTYSSIFLPGVNS